MSKYKVTGGEWKVDINSVGQRWVESEDKNIALFIGEDDEALANAEFVVGLKGRFGELKEDNSRLRELLRRVMEEIFPDRSTWGEILDDDLISELAAELEG